MDPEKTTTTAEDILAVPPDLNIGNQTATPEEVALLEPPATTTAPPADQNATVADDPDDEDAGTRTSDAELDAAGTDAERAQIIERRRNERTTRNQRRREKIESLERRLNALAEINRQQAQDLAAIKQQGVGVQLAQLREAEGKAVQAVTHFKNIIADATTKGDGATAAEATQRMLEAQQFQSSVAAAREQFERVAAAPAAPHLDPVMVDNVKAFAAKNTWYKGPRATDPDSRVLTAIDTSLGAEGWDPSTPAYWTELEARASKYLPHRFPAAQAPGAKPGYNGSATAVGSRPPAQPTVVGSGSSASSGSQSTTGYIVSAERIKAMKEAGIWGDPVRRDAMIKRYQAQDKAARSGR